MAASTATSKAAAPAGEERSIVATRVFDAPRDLVFRMWTDREHIAHWWGPKGFTNTIHSMEVKPGGAWKFVMHGPDGTDYQNHIIYREIVKDERIAYSHVSGPLFEAVATFSDEGRKTRLTVRMEFETAALRDKVATEFGAVEGLNQTLDRLGEEAAKARDEFVITRVVDAPRALVFKVWTDAEHLAKWFGPKGVRTISAKNDLRPGGVYHYGMRTPDGTEMWGKWVYREIVAPERLVFVNSFSDDKGGLTRHPMAAGWPLEMLSTITFEEAAAGKTAIAVRSIPLNATDAERETFAAGHASMTGGWSGTFEELDDYLAGLQRARTAR